MSDIKKRLVFSILQFLQQSIKDGTIKEEDTEGVEVAGSNSIASSGCISSRYVPVIANILLYSTMHW